MDFDLPLYKLIRQPVIPIMGSSVDAAPFVLLVLLLITGYYALARGKNITFLRRISQIVSALIFIIFLHQCLCMIRGWVFALKAVGRDDLMAFRNLSMFIILVAAGLTMGRLFCGWICPIGFFNEIISKIASLKARLPRRIRLTAGYLMLAGITILVFWLAWLVRPGTQFFAENVAAIFSMALLVYLFFVLPKEDHDHKIKRIKYYSILIWMGLSIIGIFVTSPWCTLFGNEVDYSSIVSLVAVLAASAIVPMAWCRYICPLGNSLGWLTRFGITRKIDASKCRNCSNCARVCPMGALDHGTSDETSCIACGRCMEKCGYDWKVKK